MLKHVQQQVNRGWDDAGSDASSGSDAGSAVSAGASPVEIARNVRSPCGMLPPADKYIEINIKNQMQSSILWLSSFYIFSNL